MKNYKNNHKRNKYRGNGDRNYQRNGNGQKLVSDFTNISNHKRKIQPRNNLNLSKLIEKYTSYAREALSNGDKILYENYLQHADHFTRVQVSKENIKRKDGIAPINNNIISQTENADEPKEKKDNGEINNLDN
tara:strand:+ start:75 stop:473 length:399 start_codon:yes stop_codon:yes gene_type:complete